MLVCPRCGQENPDGFSLLRGLHPAARRRGCAGAAYELYRELGIRSDFDAATASGS